MNVLKTVLLLFIMQGSSLTAQQLSNYRWKNRILILSDNQIDSIHTKAALKILHNHSKEIKERDLILFLYKEGKFYNTDRKEIPLKNANSITKNLNGYMLVGKDGSIKSSQPYPLRLEEVFTLIDGMPMRKSEIKSDN